jgi:acyl carrier protein
MSPVEERIVAVLDPYARNPVGTNLDQRLVDDLGMDSMDLAELLMDLEDEFGLEIPDVDFEQLHTPQQIANYLNARGVV